MQKRSIPDIVTEARKKMGQSVELQDADGHTVYLKFRGGDWLMTICLPRKTEMVSLDYHRLTTLLRSWGHSFEVRSSQEVR